MKRVFRWSTAVVYPEPVLAAAAAAQEFPKERRASSRSPLSSRTHPGGSNPIQSPGCKLPRTPGNLSGLQSHNAAPTVPGLPAAGSVPTVSVNLGTVAVTDIADIPSSPSSSVIHRRVETRLLPDPRTQ